MTESESNVSIPEAVESSLMQENTLLKKENILLKQGASPINLLLQNPEMHVVLFEMKRMSLTRLLLYIEGLAVL